MCVCVCVCVRVCVRSYACHALLVIVTFRGTLITYYGLCRTVCDAAARTCADVYASGVFMWEVLTGKKPYYKMRTADLWQVRKSHTHTHTHAHTHTQGYWQTMRLDAYHARTHKHTDTHIESPVCMLCKAHCHIAVRTCPWLHAYALCASTWRPAMSLALTLLVT